MLPRRGARQQQNGNIAASNQQQQGNRPEEQIERSTKLLDEILVEPNHMQIPEVLREILRRLLPELSNQRLESRIRLRVCDARLEANARIKRFHLVAGDLQRQI